MPAPCRVCGFVDSAELMKKHMVEKHGFDKRTLKSGHSAKQEIVLGPTITQVEAQVIHVIGDMSLRILKARIRKGASPNRIRPRKKK